MRAVDRTTNLFLASVREALPGVRTSVSRSKNSHGRSNYVFIYTNRRSYKIRISDHPIGMRRARAGYEDCYIIAGAGPDRWSVWLSELAATLRKAAAA